MEYTPQRITMTTHRMRKRKVASILVCPRTRRAMASDALRPPAAHLYPLRCARGPCVASRVFHVLIDLVLRIVNCPVRPNECEFNIIILIDLVVMALCIELDHLI